MILILINKVQNYKMIFTRIDIIILNYNIKDIKKNLELR